MIDLAIVIAAFIVSDVVASYAHLPATGAIAVVVAIGAATWRLARAATGWRDLGVRKPDSWAKTIGWIVALYVASAVVTTLVIEPFGNSQHWAALNLSRFAGLHGHTLSLIGWLFLVWISAAVGEELLFRGFLLNQLMTVFGCGRLSATAAVLTQALLFGVAHFYLGPRGMLTAGWVGILYGFVYLLNGRNLVILMLAHGLTDSISILAIYLGKVPGLQ